MHVSTDTILARGARGVVNFAAVNSATGTRTVEAALRGRTLENLSDLIKRDKKESLRKNAVGPNP